MTKTVVIDPGHGGSADIGNSAWNNAVSYSQVLEKTMTLELSIGICNALRNLANSNSAQIRIFLTREDDSNLGLSNRAAIAKSQNADIFLSIHFNDFDENRGGVRGTESYVCPRSINSNFEANMRLATSIQNATFSSIQQLDSNARDRGVKEGNYVVLREENLGSKVSACLLEVEFIDNQQVDQLLNTNPNSLKVKSQICMAIARAIFHELYLE